MENKDLKEWYKTSFEALETDAPDNSWESIRTELHPSEEAIPVVQLEPSPQKRSSWRWAIGIAACLAIAFGTYVVFPTQEAPAVDFSQLVDSHLGNRFDSKMTKEAADIFHLPDGSTVFLNEGSKIAWAEDFVNKRTIVLTGEAFFNVQHDPAHPFKVHVGNTTAEVLGTSFNLNDRGNNVVDLEVLTGKVRFSSAADASLTSLFAKGDVATWDNVNSVIGKSKTTTALGTHWFENQEMIRKTPLFQEELARSELYLRVESEWQRNTSNETVIKTEIENSASLLEFEAIELRATYINEEGEKMASKFFTVYGPFEPGANLEIEHVMLDWVDSTVEIEVTIENRIPVN